MAINQDQVIHWVSGKGGVGKSTVAASLALSFAQKGLKTLLVELGEKSFYRFLFNRPVEHRPEEVQPGLSLARWEGEACLHEYFLHLFKLERIVDLFFENRVMKALIQAAPGLRELALTGKITSGIRGIGPALSFDRIVVDGFSSGHFRVLIEAPRAMAKAIPVGPMAEQSRSIDRVLCSSKNCRYHVVMAPEDLPVTEGLELCEFLRTGFKVSPEIVMNRWIVPPVSHSELKQSNSDFASYLDELLNRQESFETRICREPYSARMIPALWGDDLLNRLTPYWEKP